MKKNLDFSLCQNIFIKDEQEEIKEPPVHIMCKRHCPYITLDGKYTDSAEEAFSSFSK